jgi:hypothetical protein
MSNFRSSGRKSQLARSMPIAAENTLKVAATLLPMEFQNRAPFICNKAVAFLFDEEDTLVPNSKLSGSVLQC